MCMQESFCCDWRPLASTPSLYFCETLDEASWLVFIHVLVGCFRHVRVYTHKPHVVKAPINGYESCIC